MLPIDEDILITRYGDDPIAAEWYRLQRDFGFPPDIAIRNVDEMREMVNRLPYVMSSISQQQALQRYADACASVLGGLHGLEAYQPPSDQDLAAFADAVSSFADALIAPLTAEQIERLVDQAQQVVVLLRQHHP